MNKYVTNDRNDVSITITIRQLHISCNFYYFSIKILYVWCERNYQRSEINPIVIDRIVLVYYNGNVLLMHFMLKTL